VAAVTGATDYVTDGRRLLAVANGHPLLGRVTGTGCSVSALVGAFAAAGRGDHVEATAAALAVFGRCAERVAAAAPAGPQSFQTALFDELYRITPEEAAREARVHAL